MSEVLREPGRQWREQDQDHEPAPAMVIHRLAMQAPGMGPKELEIVPGLCPDMPSWEKRGSRHEVPCFTIQSNPLLALVWGSMPRRGRAEGPAMAGTAS